jgi:hypothetical protein
MFQSCGRKEHIAQDKLMRPPLDKLAFPLIIRLANIPSACLPTSQTVSMHNVTLGVADVSSLIDAKISCVAGGSENDFELSILQTQRRAG